MPQAYRASPVRFDASAHKTEERNGWTVVLEYADEQDGPWLIDLCHLPRWDVQDRDVGQYRPGEQEIPATPGMCVLEENMLINRMNQTQAAVWYLGPKARDMPKEPAYTDIQESTACLALVGTNSLAVSEKVSNLDLADPNRSIPCLIQGPLARVPCQMVLLGSTRQGEGFVFTCARGYARDMLQALLQAGKEFALRPAGERRMAEFLEVYRDS